MPFFYFLDIFYLILIIPALIFALLVQSKLQSNLKKYSRVQSYCGCTGAQIAEKILNSNDIYDVNIYPIGGEGRGFYDFGNGEKKIGLTQDIYYGTSIVALSIAAHEVGHAIQHKEKYKLFEIKGMLKTASNIGSYIYFLIILLGIFLSSQNLINFGIILFSLTAIFLTILTYSEFNASKIAVENLEKNGLLYEAEKSDVKKMLNSMALTYVAALVSSLAQLLRLILIFGGRRRD